MPVSLSNVTDLDGNTNASGAVFTVNQGGFLRQVFIRKDVTGVPTGEIIANTSVATGVGSAKTISYISEATNQLWILSEAGGSFDVVGIDNINEHNQYVFKNYIEKYSNVNYIISCNDINKIYEWRKQQIY